MPGAWYESLLVNHLISKQDNVRIQASDLVTPISELCAVILRYYRDGIACNNGLLPTLAWSIRGDIGEAEQWCARTPC
jgi:hypothetical protein